MAEPAKAFPEGDPRNAIYGETIAALRHANETTLSELTSEEGREKANDLYAQEQITKSEPGAFRGQLDRYNRGGLLQSGIFSRERGGLQSQFVGKHYAISHRETENTEKRNSARQRAKENLESGEGRATTRALTEGQAASLQTPAQPTPPPGTPQPPTVAGYRLQPATAGYRTNTRRAAARRIR